MDGWPENRGGGGRKKGAGWRVAGVPGLSLAGTLFNSLCARLCIAQLEPGSALDASGLGRRRGLGKSLIEQGSSSEPANLRGRGRTWRLAMSRLSHKQGPHCIGM